MVDTGTPRNAPAAHMQGFLSRDGMSPSDLIAAGRAEVCNYGVEFIEDEVVEITTGFTLRLGRGGSITARRLLVATGAVDELPDIPGARERWGRDFLHCPYCHGWEVRDQPIGVLGTGPGSVDHAQLLRQWSDDVIFFAHTYPTTASERAAMGSRDIPVIDGLVARVSIVDDRLDAVELADGRAVPRTAVFIRPALHAREDGLLATLDCRGRRGRIRPRRRHRSIERARPVGRGKRHQPTCSSDHRRRRRIRCRDCYQRRPRRRGRPQRPAEHHKLDNSSKNHDRHSVTFSHDTQVRGGAHSEMRVCIVGASGKLGAVHGSARARRQLWGWVLGTGSGFPRVLRESQGRRRIRCKGA